MYLIRFSLTIPFYLLTHPLNHISIYASSIYLTHLSMNPSSGSVPDAARGS
ncbi:hypothetical protein E2C01_092737 [Portunus trituberculatus]|uniref:Uncharacterized protein n=1 Tax=Portunus trituberculatus TaxID=210409 RepID=A0A5B7JMV4_PORTR|nr:hypothetical protein [Portunus trituberculatus]